MSLSRWERITEWPLTAVALAFLAAYSWETIDPTLPTDRHEALDGIVTASWLVFAVDYLVRLLLAPSRRAFVRAHVVDLVAVVLPMARPLRLLRLVVLVRVVNRTVGSNLRGRVAVYVGGATAFVIYIAALAVLDAERGAPGATIVTVGDALWWALATVTTVGYGDFAPVTATGRIVAAGLMISGIALLGVVTASMATWFLDRVRRVEDDAQAATRRDVEALTEQVAALREELRAGRRD